MRAKRQVPIKKKPVFAILVDGQTEFWYLQMLKRHERDMKFDIKPEIPQHKKLSDQYSKVIKLSKIYDRVYWIVDLDVILKESLLAKKGGKKSIDTFLHFKEIIEKKYKNVEVIINQPCLEYWFLLHFEKTAQPFSNCDEAGKRLMKHLPNYEKTQKYFTKENQDIYLTLKLNLNTAIANSRNLPSFDNGHPNIGISGMFKLFDDLGLS